MTLSPQAALLIGANVAPALFAASAYFTRAMGDAPEFIKIRHIENCLKADPAYGEGVAGALGITLEKAT